MSVLKGLAARVRALARRTAAERELDDEIRFHLELETEKNLRLGLPPDEARRRALVAFGGVAQAKEAHRAVRGAPLLETLAADARYALRTLWRSPALAGAAVLTLALGVGANAAIFSAVSAVILRPLPVRDQGRLVMLWEENPDRNWYKNIAAAANVLDWREQVAAFEDVAAYTWNPGGSATLTGGCPLGRCEPRIVRVARVTGNFFDVLGARAERGRTLRDEETWVTAPDVAVISHALWRDQFGADPGIVGRSVQLSGRAIQVVGVMPARFSLPWEGVDVWASVRLDRANRDQVWFRRAHWMRAIARLKPGVSLAQADAQLQAVVRRLQRQYPVTNTHMGAGMTPLHDFLVGDTRLPLLVLLGAVLLLLLIACANVGNLLLVRAAGRERETALRLALGAGRGRVVRQAMTESLVLSALGGAAGLALGWWGTRALRALQPEGMLRVSDYGMDWGVFAYVLAVTALSGVLFGIAPALWAGRRLPAEALREGGRTGSDGRRMRRWGEALVVAEVALALLLTLGAGLLVRSFWELRRVSPGLDPSGVLTASLDIPDARYDSGDKVGAFYAELMGRLRALPGVEGVAAVNQLPLTANSWSSDFSVAGRPPGEYGTEVVHRTVTPDYFRVMRVPLLRGRAFTDADRQSTTPVVVINEALARQYFRGQDPVGQRLTFNRNPDSTSVWRTIVGVVGSEHQSTLAVDPAIEIFDPMGQNRNGGMTLVVRTGCPPKVGGCEPTALAPALRRILAELDPALAFQSVRSMETVRDAALSRDRFLMTLLWVFAGVGLALAVVGVYGVMAQMARRRVREMGIRIALGAPAARVRWLVVRQGLRLVLAGLAVGTAAALLTTRALRTLLYHVAPADAPTFVAVPALLTLAAVVACWLPALQASRADPAVTLRAE